MKLLVMGGGIFVGRAIVETAVARGHQVTVFNRGRTATVFPAGVDWVRGDRDGDLAVLGPGPWDAVIDVCAYFPRQVESLLSGLAGRCDRYLLVSSVSAYASLAAPGTNENAPTSGPLDPVPETVTPESYGPLKAMCEAAAVRHGPACTMIIRPGIIIGPWDPTGRFTYWVRRLVAGGQVLAPGIPSAPLQLIDARDVAGLVVALAESGEAGAYNAVGPEAALTWGEMLAAGAQALESSAVFTWVDDEFIAAQKAGDWTNLPLYLPAAATKFAGIYRVDGRRGLRHGLRLRPLAETIGDLARWLQDPAAAGVKQMGLSLAREQELLAQWHPGGR